jgi:thioredoxin 1
MATVKVSDASFKVDFWAEWCGPCKQIGPALEQISEDMEGRIKIAKVNIDDDPETPAKFHVRGIPTLMIFKGGQVVATKVGAMTKTKRLSVYDILYLRAFGFAGGFFFA